ncbi:MAG: SPOR domain-containing protein [Gemmatimonadaceae bacterium]
MNKLSSRSANLLARVASKAAIVALLTLSVSSARAQGTPPVSPAVSAAAARARSLADAGNGAKARELLDSLVTASPRESLEEAEALYWRALFSEQADDAERDWKQLVVDVPFSPRAAEALLRLSELELTRSNAALARQYALRLLSDYSDSPERPRAMLLLTRLYFDANDSPRACGVLTVVRRDAPLSAVEVRLQADELQQQCRGVREIAMGATPDSTASVPIATVPPSAPPLTAPVNPPVSSATKPPVTTKVAPVTTAPVTPPKTVAAVTPPPTTKAPATTSTAATPPPVIVPPAVNAPPISNQGDTAVFKVEPHPSKPPVVEKPRAVGKWTVQIAAYDSRAQAEALVQRLSARKIDAHSAGSKKPFRVQVGRYATRAEATSSLVALRKKGQKGFVTEVGTP